MGAEPLSGIRHLTATGFVVWGGAVLLHWHAKNRLWLPLGGHIDENEDPVQTVLREIEEESGIVAELLPGPLPFAFTDPPQLPPPVTILVERATDGRQWHEHIDLIYFCRPAGGVDGLALQRDPTLRWVDEAALRRNVALAPTPGTEAVVVPLDVRMLGIAAIEAARALTLSG